MNSLGVMSPANDIIISKSPLSYAFKHLLPFKLFDEVNVEALLAMPEKN